jgi:hypothetical protein
MPKRPSELRPEWDALQAEAAALADPNAKGRETRAAALELQKDLLCAAAWVGEVQDLADVLILSEIAWDVWNFGTFPVIAEDIEDRGEGAVALAYLCRSVFIVASKAQVSIADGRNS